ncbi:MAG TPA: tetratricopeptide repeat protein [Candidatus Acidoferrum sp.]|nr:tetratricopeptide repeat protein [Candidatus Acidoferrum sp.]
MLTIKNQAGKILIFFLAAVTLFAGCTPPGPRALLRGKKLLEQGKYLEAIEKLKTATLLLGGTNAQAYNYLGLACHEAGQLAEAEKAYQKAVALNPDLAEARYNLGCLALDQGRFEQAKSELITYTLRRPNSADGWLKLGLTQLRQGQSAATHLRAGQLASAEKSFGEGLRLSPQNPEALTGLGLVRLQRGQPGDAKQFFSQALKSQPDYHPALLNLAIVEQQYLGQRQAALDKYREYLALKPTPENSEAVKAVVARLELELAPYQGPVAAAGPTPEATASVHSSSSASPSQVRTSLTALKPAPTETARISGMPNVTRTDFARTAMATRTESPPIGSKPAPPAAAVKPVSPPPTVPANEIEVVHLSAEPVLKTAQDVPGPVAAAPPSPAQPAETPALLPLNAPDSRFPRYRYRAPTQPNPGDRSEAERAFAQGVQAHQAQRQAEAIASYRRALQLDPSFFDADYNLALAATQVRNLPLALSIYENALALRPESSDARYNFALVLKQANYLLDAANELEKDITAYPNDGRAHLALGNLYAQQLQQPDKARSHYLKVLETDPRNPQAAAIRSWLTALSH